MQDGKHFKAELREESGHTQRTHHSQRPHDQRPCGTFEHGFTGSKMQLALDEIETRNGWVPLIGTVTGVPGDPSIKASGKKAKSTEKGLIKEKL